MVCNVVHACIERKIRKKDIYVPANSVLATKKAKKVIFYFFKDYSGKNLKNYD